MEKNPEQIRANPDHDLEQGLGREALKASKTQDLGQKVLESMPHDEWQRQWSFVNAETEPDYENEADEQELQAHPELRFHVNPDRFPILRDQAISNRTLDINETLGVMVQDTADTIAKLTGETNPPTRRADAVIYLDKSARPVSWLVNEMWTDFTDAPRPGYEGFMAIDRLSWFRAVGLDVDAQGNLNDDFGMSWAGSKAKYENFREQKEKHPISRSDLARARLALTPNGIEKLCEAMSETELEEFSNYNPLVFESYERDQGEMAPELPEWIIEKIYSIPTGLEGKKIVVIDEVENSGATARIACDIISDAIGDPDTELDTHIFWHAGVEQIGNQEFQMQSAPVWYDHDVNPELGKGIGDVNFRLLREEFLQNPDLEHLNALYIAPFRGRSLDMEGKEGESSVELMKEFQRLAKIYREGRVLMSMPKIYDEEKWLEHYEDLGVEFTPDPKVKNSYMNIRKNFQN